MITLAWDDACGWKVWDVRGVCELLGGTGVDLEVGVDILALGGSGVLTEIGGGGGGVPVCTPSSSESLYRFRFRVITVSPLAWTSLFSMNSSTSSSLFPMGVYTIRRFSLEGSGFGFLTFLGALIRSGFRKSELEVLGWDPGGSVCGAVMGAGKGSPWKGVLLSSCSSK